MRATTCPAEQAKRKVFLMAVAAFGIKDDCAAV